MPSFELFFSFIFFFLVLCTFFVDLSSSQTFPYHSITFLYTVFFNHHALYNYLTRSRIISRTLTHKKNRNASPFFSLSLFIFSLFFSLKKIRNESCSRLHSPFFHMVFTNKEQLFSYTRFQRVFLYFLF